MGTEIFGLIGCILAENGPFVGGIESSFWDTAGVLRAISYVFFFTYTRTFSNQGPLTFSKAHALSYTHSKVGNDHMHIRGEIYGHRKFGNDQMYIRGEWALRRWH